MIDTYRGKEEPVKPDWEPYERTIPGAHFEGCEQRLKDRMVFKLRVKHMVMWLKLASEIPNSSVHWIDYEHHGLRGVSFAALIWLRRHKIEELELAIAHVSMATDKTIILLRSFSGPLHRSDYK